MNDDINIRTRLSSGTADQTFTSEPSTIKDDIPQTEPYIPYGEQKESHVATKPRKITLTKYTIYVTTHRMYIVGSNGRETVFRILEIDLTNTEKLVILEDNVYFTRNEIMDVLNGLEESSEGGLTKKVTAVGLLGFIRFTKHYYLCVVTKRRPVAILGGYQLFHIDGTELIPVTDNPRKPDRNSEEARYIATFMNIDLTKTFYYSYSYDLTNTLQVNFLRNKKQSLGLNHKDLAKTFEFNDRFVWNSTLLKPVFNSFDRVYDWFQPIIHGFIDQVKISIFQVDVYVTIIARRSHHFAGARFFKRGVNDKGDVANEVETEQIVSDMLTTSFHDPRGGFYNNPRYTSFVQHRGSIPLSWSQETAPNIRMTKPPIELNVIDPFYSKSALHFDDLFRRYGSPIQILNLIKQREKAPRETKLLKEFENCIDYLNKSLPDDKKIRYKAWDMSRASKSRGQDVIQWLENYSDESLKTTGFFHNGLTLENTNLQQGICRTNCIDCLDRTNTAQFVIGKRALGYQLHALGLIKETYLEYDSDAINILTEMFHDHGDTIALQYGGSHLVNTLQTYRKINQWTSHSRDMIESVKRFYSNSFVDAQRQEAINLFLGNYVYEEGIPMLWDLNTDYYLHNKFSDVNLNYKPSYTHWYSDVYLGNYKGALVKKLKQKQGYNYNEVAIRRIDPYAGCFDNYWNSRYVPRELSSLSDIFEYNMNSTLKLNEAAADQAKEAETAESVASPKSSLARLPFLSSGADHESQFGSENNDNYEPPELQYISPFKSRKPHRELKVLNLNASMTDMKYSITEFQGGERNDKDIDDYLQLTFFRNQLKKYEENNSKIEDELTKKNSKMLSHIKNTGSLPVVDVDTNSFLVGDVLVDFDESYFDDTLIYRGGLPGTHLKDNSPHLKDNNNNEIATLNETEYKSILKENMMTTPQVTSESLTVYCDSLDLESKLSASSVSSSFQNKTKIKEYSNLTSPRISPDDLRIYDSFSNMKLKSSDSDTRKQNPLMNSLKLIENDSMFSHGPSSPHKQIYKSNAVHLSHGGDYFTFNLENDIKLNNDLAEYNGLDTVINGNPSSDAVVGGLHNGDSLSSPFYLNGTVQPPITPEPEDRLVTPILTSTP